MFSLFCPSSPPFSFRWFCVYLCIAFHTLCALSVCLSLSLCMCIFACTFDDVDVDQRCMCTWNDIRPKTRFLFFLLLSTMKHVQQIKRYFHPFVVTLQTEFSFSFIFSSYLPGYWFILHSLTPSFFTLFSIILDNVSTLAFLPVHCKSIWTI